VGTSKGQSAIEYLTTYGWMILAVAVVSGVAYSSIQSSCTETFSDFYTDAIEVNNFGIDGSGNFAISLKNSRYSKLEFNSINISIDDKYIQKEPELNLTAGESGQLKIPGFSDSEACNTLDVKINFDRGNLEDQDVTGIIRAPIRIQ
jgi:hypothetical protein